MWTLLKLLVAAAVLNAALRCGSAALSYYQLKDEAQQLVLFGERETPEVLAAQIVEEAESRDIPLDAEDVEVRREGARTVAEASYVQEIEVFPTYRYPMTFTFTVEAFGMHLVPTTKSPAPQRR